MSRHTAAAKAVFCAVVLLFAASVGLPAQSAPAHLQAGLTALARGDSFGAVERFSMALSENPDFFEAHLGLAEAYYRLDEYDQALAAVERAARLRRDNVALLNLEARIQIGLGNPAAAGRIFDRILERERFNVDALLGRAELAVAQGRTDEAARRYDDAIRLAPTERRALLALAVLYDHLGESDLAGDYIRLAVRHHPEHAVVHLLAAEHYLQTHRLADADRHVRTALTIDANLVDGLFLQAHLSLIGADYDGVLATVEQMIGLDSGDARAWYLRGVALAEIGDLDEALHSFRRALTVRPDEEIPRMAAEQLLLERTDAEDPRRVEFGRHHAAQARAFAGRNLFARALASYRRSLQLNPYDHAARIAYADLYRLRGFEARYLEELRVVDALGGADGALRDRIEAFESALADSVSVMWGVNQFDLPRDRTRIDLFFAVRPTTSEYPQSASFLAIELQNELLGFEMIDVPRSPERFDGFAQAYRIARSASTDYFAVVDFTQAGRSFSAEVILYVGRTGTEIARYRASRTGNDRVHRALSAVAGQMAATIPLRGSIVRRDAERVLVNLGSLHGVTEGDELEIVQRGSLILRSDQPGYSFAATDVLGTYQVARVDDLVSEGSVTSRTVFDFVNTADEVIRPAEGGGPAAEAGLFPPIYRRIRSIR